MTYYISRDEYSASSEEYFPDQRSDSVLFSQPSEVDQWCQSVPVSSGFPLTPPDTASDCDLSDLSDMASQSWTMPEDEWSNNFSSDPAAWLQSSECDWNTHKSPMANPESQVGLDSSAWLRTTYGAVDTGLSPALSHASQTSRTLSGYAHPTDVPLLPPALDLSFVSNLESTWAGQIPTSSQEQNTVHPEAYLGSMDPTAFPTVEGIPAYSMYPVVAGTPMTVNSPQASLYSAPGLEDQSRRRTTSDASTAYQRPLLPRTNPAQMNLEPHAPSSQCRTLKPRKTSVGLADTVHRVSDASGPSQVANKINHGYVYVPGPRPSMVQAIGSHSVRPGVTSSPEIQYQARPLAPIPHPPQESSTLDMDSFIKYDQDEQPSAKVSSYPQVNIPTPALNPVISGPHNEPPSWPQSASLPTPVVNNPNEIDEGRHRNHPLYSRGPNADGMYHCPFENDQNCQHKPAKLKCAYDKFVDSHLKPFRCKNPNCSKQEFSSTACLLRHEREAHGMHGHGDRPHLCHYRGCERAQPGSGFPRKYNLYDHMKRVHDHKEDPTQDQSAYPNGDSRGARKSGGRKRKSSGPMMGEPATSRPRQSSHGYEAPSFTSPQWAT